MFVSNTKADQIYIDGFKCYDFFSFFEQQCIWQSVLCLLHISQAKCLELSSNRRHINSKQWPTVRLCFGLAIRIYDVFTMFQQCNGQLEFPKLSKSLVSLTECAWDSQDNALWDTL